MSSSVSLGHFRRGRGLLPFSSMFNWMFLFFPFAWRRIILNQICSALTGLFQRDRKKADYLFTCLHCCEFLTRIGCPSVFCDFSKPYSYLSPSVRNPSIFWTSYLVLTTKPTLYTEKEKGDDTRYHKLLFLSNTSIYFPRNLYNNLLKDHRQKETESHKDRINGSLLCSTTQSVRTRNYIQAINTLCQVTLHGLRTMRQRSHGGIFHWLKNLTGHFLRTGPFTVFCYNTELRTTRLPNFRTLKVVLYERNN